MSPTLIDRAFVRLEAGLVHYRHTGQDRPGGPLPLYMAHSGPGSSLVLAPLIAELGSSRRVIAPDMMGNGDSDPPPIPKTDIAFYADGVVRVLDALGVERIDFFGDHTGAQIGCELAVTRPDRVRRLVMDGLGLFPSDLRAELLARYAPPVQPDHHGGHLAWAWSFVSELSLHFPYFHRDPAHRLMAAAVAPPEVRQRLATDLIKALPTYHLAYQAAFSHNIAERLTQVRVPTLVLASDGDPLGAYVDEAAALVPGAVAARSPRERRASVIAAFLDA